MKAKTEPTVENLSFRVGVAAVPPISPIILITLLIMAVWKNGEKQ